MRFDTPGAYSMSLDLTTLYLVSAMVTGMSGLLFLLDMRGRPDPRGSGEPVPRARDLFCRYGGEEFAALLPGASPDVAGVVAERVLRAVRGVTVWTPAGPLRPTTSIGISAANVESIDLGALMRVADIALYRAKRGGRDRAEGAGDTPEALPKTLLNA